MTQYIIRRLVGMIPTALILIFLIVLLVRLIPGDIIDIILSEQGGGGSEKAAIDRQQLEERLGLDRPLLVQYVDYVSGVVRGDLGNSLWDQRPVRDQIWSRSLVTAQIAFIAIVVSMMVAIPIGVISAIRQDRFIDYLLRSISIAGISIPNFVIGTAIVIFPALWWGWAVSFRYVSFTEDPIQHLIIVVPPAAVLGVQLSATVARITRTMMLEVMQQDYVRTARAKGLNEFSVILRHALKNAMIPVITLLGLQLAFLVGGSVITESIFAIPGLGRLLIEAIADRDYPIVQGFVVVIGFLVMFVNLLIDLSYVWLDPRVRLA